MPIVETVFKVKDDASKKIKDINKSTLELNKGLMKIGGVMASAFAVKNIYDFGKSTVDLAVKMDGLNRSIAGIEYSLGSFGKNTSWKDAQTQTKAQIETIKKLSTEYGVLVQDALNVRKQLAEPLSFMKLDDKTELSALVAAQAAAYGASAEQYADEIDKLFSPAGLKDKAADLFKRLDIGLDLDQLNKLAKTAPNELALKIKEAMKADPALKDFAETFAGSSNKLKNSWDAVKEKMGEALIPTLTELVKELDSYISSGDFKEDVQTVVGILKDIAKGSSSLFSKLIFGKRIEERARIRTGDPSIKGTTGSETMFPIPTKEEVESWTISNAEEFYKKEYKRFGKAYGEDKAKEYADFSLFYKFKGMYRFEDLFNDLAGVTAIDEFAGTISNFSDYTDFLNDKLGTSVLKFRSLSEIIPEILDDMNEDLERARARVEAEWNKPPKPIPVELDINLKSDIPQYANLNFNSNGTTDNKQIKPNGRGSARLGAK